MKGASGPQVPRVAFVLADLEAGGAQRVILTVVAHLDRSRIDPCLVVVNPWGPLRRDLPGHVPIHNMGASRLRRAVPGLVRMLRRLRPDVVVATVSHLNLALLAVKPLLPRHTRLLVREANTPSARLQRTAHPKTYRLLYRLFYPRSDGILCNSRSMKKDMVGSLGLRAGKIRVVPNPVDTERVRARICQGENPFVGDGIHLVAVGRLNPQKGFDLLLHVLRKAVKAVPDLHVTLVGEGPERGRLERLASALEIRERVTFAGHQDNPYPFMAHADLLVSSSRYEGSPNAVLESLACGTPVLAFDCPGGTREILEPGINGWLVPAEDTDAMAVQLIAIVQARAWKSMEARGLLPEAFACKTAVRAYESVLFP